MLDEILRLRDEDFLDQIGMAGEMDDAVGETELDHVAMFAGQRVRKSSRCLRKSGRLPLSQLPFGPTGSRSGVMRMIVSRESRLRRIEGVRPISSGTCSDNWPRRRRADREGRLVQRHVGHDRHRLPPRDSRTSTCFPGVGSALMLCLPRCVAPSSSSPNLSW